MSGDIKKEAVKGAARGHISVHSSYIQIQSNTPLDIAKAVYGLLSYPVGVLQIRHRGFESHCRLFNKLLIVNHLWRWGLRSNRSFTVAAL